VTASGRGEQSKAQAESKLRSVCEDISRAVGGHAPAP
jgi:hypothetical protein